MFRFTSSNLSNYTTRNFWFLSWTDFVSINFYCSSRLIDRLKDCSFFSVFSDSADAVGYFTWLYLPVRLRVTRKNLMCEFFVLPDKRTLNPSTFTKILSYICETTNIIRVIKTNSLMHVTKCTMNLWQFYSK